nr:hypothetical protein [Tanacetum cinerariifolium]
MEGIRFKRNTKDNSRGKWKARDEPPSTLAAYLGRNKNGQPLQCSLTSIHGGRLFANQTGSVTLFVRWIEDYPLPDGLKMPSHVASYDGKGDPNNYLHLFEGDIRMKKWIMPVACHMFTYALKDSAQICLQKRFTKTHLALHSIKQRECESVRAFATRYTDDTLQILGLHEDQRISGFVHGLRIRNLELRHQIQEEVESGRLAHLVKGLKKKKEKVSDTQLGEWKEEKRNAKPVETHVLIINIRSCNPRKRDVEEHCNKVGEITFPSLLDKSLTDRVIIKAYVSGRLINMDRHETIRDRGIHYPWGYKFHTPKGIGTLLSGNNQQRPMKEQRISSEA